MAWIDVLMFFAGIFAQRYLNVTSWFSAVWKGLVSAYNWVAGFFKKAKADVTAVKAAVAPAATPPATPPKA